MYFRKYTIIIVCLLLINMVPLVFSEGNANFYSETKNYNKQFQYSNINEDLDPLVDLQLTVEINKIRAFDIIDEHSDPDFYVKVFSDPDFYVKVFINDNEFKSPVWKNTKFVENPDWSATCDVPDDIENVTIKIQLWDWNIGLNRLCDIASDNQLRRVRDIELIYNLKIGHWNGGDYSHNESIFADPSGYGRLNGCDDGSINREDMDCELFFNIYQNDYDKDGIPYWTEVNIYGSNPQYDNTGEDIDNDGIPIEWEYKWGLYMFFWGITQVYSPFIWEDHKHFDSDEDGLNNYEEYLTSQWGSDPYRKDLFIELDQMQVGPNGEGHLIPEASKIMWREPYHKHNVVFHLDDGSLGGGNILLFDSRTSHDELLNYYLDEFIKNDPNNWRRGVFHYGLVLYHAEDGPGFAFNGTHEPFINCWTISTDHHEKFVRKNPIYSYLRVGTFNRDFIRARMYAGAMMHETGHTLGVFSWNSPGCDNNNGMSPWQIGYWRFGNYKSVMNYRYTYAGLDNKVDYSDGSHGINDFDDWSFMDFQFFQRPQF